MTRASSRVTPARVALTRYGALALNFLGNFTLSSGRVDWSEEVRSGQVAAIIKALRCSLLCVAEWISLWGAGFSRTTILGRGKRRGYSGRVR